MFTPSHRREFLQAIAAASASLALPRLARAQRPAPIEVQPQGAAAPAIASTALAGRVWLITGAGCNVLVVGGADDLVMIDGGLAENSAALLRAVAQASGTDRVRTLVNTHWHADHTGSNEALGGRGTTIIAHANTRRWLSSRVYRELQDRVYLPRPAEALPTKTLTRPEVLTAGGERIELGPLPPAHTNGDLYAFLPGANVLMVSDALTVGRYPVADYSTGGWIGGLIEAGTTLLAIANDRTRIIPGIGAMQTRADLQAQNAMLTAVRDRVWGMIRQGKSLREVVAETPTRDFDATWGASDAFLQSVYVGLVRHTHEMGGVL